MKKALSIILASLLIISLLPVSVFAEAPKDIEIHEVNIEGFIPPVVGSCPADSYNLYVVEGQHYSILYSYWHDNTVGGDMFDEDVPFTADHMYSNGCIVCHEEGYAFAADCVFSFNGDTALVDPEYPQSYYLFGALVVQSTPVAPVDPSAVLPGDADESGTVDINDALIVLRAAMELIELTPEQEAAADVNGDGAVDISDALLILRFSMGLINEL